ncbi:MAG: hypothetical protein QM755_02630 [Luteolibacter sp.]
MKKGQPHPRSPIRNETSGINRSCFFDINIKELDRACERWLRKNDPDWLDYKRRAQACTLEPSQPRPPLRDTQ